MLLQSMLAAGMQALRDTSIENESRLEGGSASFGWHSACDAPAADEDYAAVQYYAFVEEKQKVHCLNTLFSKVSRLECTVLSKCDGQVCICHQLASSALLLCISVVGAAARRKVNIDLSMQLQINQSIIFCNSVNRVELPGQEDH